MHSELLLIISFCLGGLVSLLIFRPKKMKANQKMISYLSYMFSIHFFGGIYQGQNNKELPNIPSFNDKVFNEFTIYQSCNFEKSAKIVIEQMVKM